jgi:hypothetical protein
MGFTRGLGNELGGGLLNALQKIGSAGAKRLLGRIEYGIKPAREFVGRASDAVTDPQTYTRLAIDAERTLGRALPPQFSGSNFGNIPARATGLLNDLTGKTNRQRSVEAGMVDRVIRGMAGEVPTRPQITGQTAGGAFRAPSVGQAAPRQNPQLVPESIPAGDPYAQDYGLTRQLMRDAGGGSMRRVAERLAADAIPNPRASIAPVDRAIDPRRFLPDLSNPGASVSPADIDLAARVRQLPQFRRNEYIDDLRGMAPSPRAIPTSAEDTLQGTFLRPGPGEIGGQARLRYAPGTPGVGGTKLGNKTYGTAAEADLLQGPNVRTDGLSVAEMIEQGIPSIRRAPGGEVRGRSFFTELDPSTGRMEIDPRINPYPTSRVVLDAVGNAVDEVAPLAAVNPRAFLPNLQGPSVPVREVDQILAAGLRNAAGGVQTTDLSSMLRNPAVLALMGGGAGVGAGVGVYNTFSNNEGSAPLGQQPLTTSPPPGEPPVSPTSLNPTPNVLVRENDGTMLGSLDSATTSQLQPGLPPPAPRLPDPTAPARVTTTGSMGADSDRRSQLAQYSPRAAAVNRAVEPRSPENYRSAEDYYAAREAYTQQAPVRQALMKYVEGTSSDPTEAAALRTWAQSYPMLAYQLQQQNLANPEANQQSGQSVMTTRVVTPMGSDTPTNAIGNVEATTAASVDPNQGNFELVDATRPMQQPQLQPQEAFMEEFLRRMSDPRREMPYQ